MKQTQTITLSDTAVRPNSTAVMLTAIICFYVLFSFFNLSPLEEDAYIYFRFAENIASGHGYVFNPGGEKIEGCSSITWLFLLVFIKLLGLNILLVVKALGIMCGCCSLVVIYNITARLTSPGLLATMPSLLTALSVPFLMRNQMGMEEPLYTLVFLSLILICVNEKYFKYWPFALFLVIISRPEGMLIALGMVPVFYHYRKQRRDIVAGIVILLVLICSLFLVRLFYFHDLLPSPFYHKVYPGKYRDSIKYLHGFLKDYYMYFFLTPLVCLLFRKEARDMQKAILLGFASVHCLWVLLAGACYFPFYRHVVPVIPVFYILVFAILVELFPLKPALRNSILIGFFGLYGCTALLLPGVNWNIWKQEPNFIAGNIKIFLSGPAPYLNSLINKIREPRFSLKYAIDSQTLVGLFIKNNYLKGTTFLYDQMGRLPYSAGTDYSFIDDNGLIDKDVAHTIFSLDSRSSRLLSLYDRLSKVIIKTIFPEAQFYSSETEIINNIFEKKPDVIMCFVFMRNMVINGLGKDPRLKKEYVPTYYIDGVLFLERRGLQKKEFNNNTGRLPVFFKNEIYAQVKEHPWLSPPNPSGGYKNP